MSEQSDNERHQDDQGRPFTTERTAFTRKSFQGSPAIPSRMSVTPQAR